MGRHPYSVHTCAYIILMDTAKDEGAFHWLHLGQRRAHKLDRGYKHSLLSCFITGSLYEDVLCFSARQSRLNRFFYNEMKQASSQSCCY